VRFSSGARLAALYTLGFAVAVLVLGLSTIFATRSTLQAQGEVRIKAEAGALLRDYDHEGTGSLTWAVRGLDQMPGELAFGLQTADGRPVAGRLATLSPRLGWSVLPGQGPHSQIRIYVVQLSDGHKLILGDQTEPWEALDGVLMRNFGAAFLAVLLIGIAGGYGLSQEMRRRLAGMNATAEAIINGDLSQRILLKGRSDDIDLLASTLNRMLDRIETLMESLRQVSNDVAHDLRTPLTRLRQRLEAALEAPAGSNTSAFLESAMDDLDAILATFSALLRIAQIDHGERRAAFRPIDLGSIVRTVVDDFSPSAEDLGQTLVAETGAGPLIEGDRELLTQMLVNLVENAMRHAGDGARITVRAQAGADSPSLTVVDDGPGIPPVERARVFDRFYRLEHSRSTPGNGLGLALVASIVRLHSAEVTLDDAAPGLRMTIRFTPQPSP
jgi:signal transduction histidine kinase